VSAELTLPQIRDLEGAKAAIVYGRIPLMTLEKCVICELYGERVQAPFFVTVESDQAPVFANAQIHGAVARNLEGKCLLEFEIILTLTSAKQEEVVLTVNAIEGEERDQKSSAISVVFINQGDDLWAVCKKALASEQVILADNPDVTFPAKADKAVVVYRKLQ